MLQSPEFVQQFTVAVSPKQAALEQRLLAQLRERVARYATLYENVYNVPQREGQLGEDPYNDEDRVTDAN